MSHAVSNGARSAADAGAGNFLDEARSLVGAELRALNACIEARLDSDIALIRELGAYVVNSGGKRLRPLSLLLSARALACDNRDAVVLAAVIEFIHTATLLHDDVVDRSDLRRGNAAANVIWGNEASVLVGDFLYSRAFQMMVECGDMEIMEVMAETTNRIAEGEVLQLLNAHDPDISEARYMQTVTCKTARLFEAAGHLAAIVAAADGDARDALSRYGLHLGIAFQLTDDLLDFSQDARGMGKNEGDDLADGNPTLPLIFAFAEAGDGDRAVIRDALESGDRGQFERVVKIIETTGALAYTSRRARAQADKAKSALQCLPSSRYRRALVELADFAVARTY